MSELISGKEALIALSNNQEVEYFDEKLGEWVYMDMTHHFKRDFRLKPRTVTINGIKVSKPQSIRWGGPERCRVEFDFDSEKEAESFYRNFTNEVFK